ncbi:MAG: winged helix DNA-binding domain-containing protein [Thermoleophilia bacterium]|nr:winged helix DNA-binding domain-containing protein [Thermoleophilia bacterium]
MTPHEIAIRRLANQKITHAENREVEKIVAALGAMQAQDYPGALWAIGLRSRDGTEAAVEKALAERKIIRTWPMRGTLHFVAMADVRWMLTLQRERIIARAATRHRQLKLDEAIFARATGLISDALHGGRQMTREELYEVLEGEKISTAGQRGYHILWRLGLDAVICFGPRQGKQQTFVMLDDWVPETLIMEREEALAELAWRYFTSHGPATVQDFIWWSGLKASDARTGLKKNASRLAQEIVDGIAYWMPEGTTSHGGGSPILHLLPGFDEFLLGYKDRSAVLAQSRTASIIPSRNGVMKPVIVIDGIVSGTWKRTFRKNDVLVTASPFEPLSRSGVRAFRQAAERYGDYLGRALDVRGI